MRLAWVGAMCESGIYCIFRLQFVNVCAILCLLVCDGILSPIKFICWENIQRVDKGKMRAATSTKENTFCLERQFSIWFWCSGLSVPSKHGARLLTLEEKSFSLLC